jgi:fatty-acyl-CoA synthase
LAGFPALRKWKADFRILDLMDFSDWIRRRADVTPEKPALIYEGAVISYADLSDRIDRLSRVLISGLGVRHGDRVAYLGLNSPEQLALLFACARTGAMLLPLNWRLAAAEHTQLINHAQPLVLFAEKEFAGHIDAEREQFASVSLVVFGEAGEGWQSFAEAERAAMAGAALPDTSPANEEDGLLLCYTSGTTGIPKGAVLSQKALFWNAQNSIDMHSLTSDDTVLTTLPMFHVGGLNIQTLPALYVGATVIVLRRFEPDQFFRALADHPVTLTLAVPTMMLAIMADPRWAASASEIAAKLRSISIGSTTVPENLITEVCEQGIPLIQVYGSTETAPIAAYIHPQDAARKPASTGKTAAHCELRIAGNDGAEAATGEKGEILVRGHNVMTKYWRDAGSTEASFTGEWFHTGDIGHFDDEGFLYVDGRLKDMIISGGENIYPAAIESLLSERPEIEEVAVVGRPDDYWGEVAVAVVVAADGHEVDDEKIMAYCKERIAHFACPRDVITVGQLPRNAMGKVLKEELRDQVFGASAAQAEQ